MKVIFFAFLVILLIPVLVSAHSIERGPETKSTEKYIIIFSTEPGFPVTGKYTHLDFTITDHNGQLLQGLNITIEMHRQETAVTLGLKEDEKGHYSQEYNFNEAERYDIHPVIDNKELDVEFELEIDSFGTSGLLRSVLIVILLLIFIGLMYRDCKRKKNG